ncbi:phosphatase PAP2 family protein [Streptomyces benahoarensis]|uniref:Phosphatase PAP2 family protein n=1 Tax=Streptomyces benahoarensis TaxID=2595054 RepID=A0A553XMD5_9ACTN|nr:phosphatase PAP2 family protein [Streptomyces benahoarensis]TSB11077.1 phosphatase PAP2 family protein [Streptomyces benahoarensis]TSB18151.1 phosphatase PAP2 family protein [Streptomyces benahoarensis]
MNSTDLYRDVTDFAHGTPGWVHSFADAGTEGGILLLMAVAVLGWWRARRLAPRAVALAVLVPVGTAVAYLLSEILKSFVQEQRPCRAVAHAAASIATCPAQGDWSFPSNHSVIAASLAVGIFIAWRAAAWLAVPVALLTGFSRVFVGVHYPHDVAVGLLVGAVVAAICFRVLAGPMTTLVIKLRTGPLKPLVEARRGSHAAG